MNFDSVKIFKSGLTLENLGEDRFDPINLENAHPALKVAPTPFEYYKTFMDENNKLHRIDRSIPRWREPNTGYSDHFPIQGIINILN